MRCTAVHHPLVWLPDRLSWPSSQACPCGSCVSARSLAQPDPVTAGSPIERVSGLSAAPTHCPLPTREAAAPAADLSPRLSGTPACNAPATALVAPKLAHSLTCTALTGPTACTMKVEDRCYHGLAAGAREGSPGAVGWYESPWGGRRREGRRELPAGDRAFRAWSWPWRGYPTRRLSVVRFTLQLARCERLVKEVPCQG